MAKIHILDEQTVTGIAAGEVVERWASVVKELVENGIDAGATSILIEVSSQERGIGSVRVTDDGCGMSPEDAVLAFVPHATSKIRSLSDLGQCRTLGFRGEALASIAAVARVTLVTRDTGDGSATRVVVAGGVQEAKETTGAPPGTSVLVETLFYNTPGRRKFQKTVGYELSRMFGMVEALALAYPGISFRLVQNGRERFHTTGSGSLSDAIVQLYGPALSRELIPVEGNGPGISVSGYISRPSTSRTNPSHIRVVVNGRPVASREIASEVKAAYGTLLPRDRHPVAFISLSTEPLMVDANVHPAKRIVRVSRIERVLEQVSGAVSDALGSRILIPDGTSIARKPLKTTFSHESPTAVGVFEPDRTGLVQTDVRLRRTEIREPEKTTFRPFPELQVIGYLPDMYIIATDHEGGLVIVDQHAAHERVLFEQVSEQKGGSQELIVPIVHHISPAESAVLPQALPALAEEGFVVEEFGTGSCIVRAVPVILGHIGDDSAVHEILDGVLRLGPGLATREEIVKLVACRGAIKAGTFCTLEQCTRLLAQLSRTSNPYSCPHGRPTLVAFSPPQLARLFKRS